MIKRGNFVFLLKITAEAHAYSAIYNYMKLRLTDFYF